MRAAPASRLASALLVVLVAAGCSETRTVGFCGDGRLTPTGECAVVEDGDVAEPSADTPADADPPDRSADTAAPEDAFDGDLDAAELVDEDGPALDPVADPETEPVADLPREPDAGPSPCPEDMALVGATCMDLYEAPNIASALPLVMYHYYEAQAWCAARGKRLCFDDEWLTACEGGAGTAYPYGGTRQPGVCNDEEIWRTYDQSQLNGWPSGAAGPAIESLEALLEAARARGAAATVAASHVESLYQGEGGGENTGCVNEYGVYDLVGNVEEWTTRRDGGDGPNFSENLKGRYWAESRTCQQNVRTHGNGFRFYEIGFRCCQDAELE